MVEISYQRPDGKTLGSVGDCFDYAMCETFFATLQCELLNRQSFKTQAAARLAAFDFIGG